MVKHIGVRRHQDVASDGVLLDDGPTTTPPTRRARAHEPEPNSDQRAVTPLEGPEDLTPGVDGDDLGPGEGAFDQSATKPNIKKKPASPDSCPPRKKCNELRLAANLLRVSACVPFRPLSVSRAHSAQSRFSPTRLHPLSTTTSATNRNEDAECPEHPPNVLPTETVASPRPNDKRQNPLENRPKNDQVQWDRVRRNGPVALKIRPRAPSNGSRETGPSRSPPGHPAPTPRLPGPRRSSTTPVR